MKLSSPFKRLKLDSSDILPISVAVLTSVAFLQSLVLIGLYKSNSELIDSRLRATLIQQTDGNAFTASPKNSNYRDPKVVRKFVQDWVTSTFSWSSQLPAPDGKSLVRDLGIPVGNLRVPTRAWLESFLLPDDMRAPFLSQVAKEWVPSDFFSSVDVETKLNIDYLSEPLLVDEAQGIWRVDVTAFFNKYTSDNPVGSVRYYNKTFLVGPVEPEQNHQELSDAANASSPVLIQSQLKERGLQIRNIQPLKLSN